MKTRRILLLALCALCLAGFNLKAQENTTYFYNVIVYAPQEQGAEFRYAYLPVYMARMEDPDKVIAVRMTNSVGMAAFTGVPIDIFKDYILTLPFKDRNIRYKIPGFSEKPSWKRGNINAPVMIDKVTEPWMTSVEKFPSGDNDKLSILDWILREFPNIGLDGQTFYDKETEATMLLLVNGLYDPTGDSGFFDVVKKLPAKEIASATLVLLTNPDEYFAGAIDIHISWMPEIEPGPNHNSSIGRYE